MTERLRDREGNHELYKERSLWRLRLSSNVGLETDFTKIMVSRVRNILCYCNFISLIIYIYILAWAWANKHGMFGLQVWATLLLLFVGPEFPY